MPKKLKKDLFGFTGASMQIGLGTMITTAMPKGAGSALTPAFGTAASMMQPAAITMMGTNIVRMTRKGLKKTKRRR